jgi:hypothetical protein
MMLLITPDDFQRLSPACRQELMSLLASRSGPVPSDEGYAYFGDDEEAATDKDQQPPGRQTIEDVLEEKRVVDINVEQARDLVANISQKSQQTLKLFARGTPVALDDLIGDSGLYKDFTELKRSFVGAVNRRLRTVSGNRLAVLFSSDRDKTRIRITPLAAASLRQVLDVQEPLPESEFFDGSGKRISADSDGAKALRDRLQSAWKEFMARPDNGLSSIPQIEVLKHLMDHGLQAQLGTPTTWDEESQSPLFEFDSRETQEQVRARLNNPYSTEDHADPDNVFLSHSKTPGVLAKLKQ